MSKRDLTGVTFGRLTVKFKGRVVTYSKCKVQYWVCECSCGGLKEIADQSLLNGHTRSCGCLIKDGWGNKVHAHPLYATWSSMRSRCMCEKNPSFPRYGGRGITVCAEWDSFEQFVEDMGDRPSSEHSIERLDNNGPYAPWNCVWASKSAQANNRRNTIRVLVNGAQKTLMQLSADLGTTYMVLYKRLVVHKQDIAYVIQELARRKNKTNLGDTTGAAQ